MPPRKYPGELMASSSTLSTPSNETPLQPSFSVRCRICHTLEVTSSTGDLLQSPCECRGSMGFVHLKCLERWLKSNQSNSCEICNFRFRTELRRRPLREWQFRSAFHNLTADQRALFCLGVANFFLLLMEIPFLYFVIKMNGQYFQEQFANGGDDLHILPFVLLSLLVFTLIFIATSVIFVIAGLKAFSKFLDYNREIVLIIPAVSCHDQETLSQETIV